MDHHRHGSRPAHHAGGRSDAGAAGARLLGAAGAAVVVMVAAFLFLGNVLADADEEPLVEPVREGRLSAQAYAAVELGATKQDVLRALRPVLPVDSRVLERYQTTEPETVAAECVYYDRQDGRAGQQYRLCFAEDVLIDKTVILAGDPGEGSAVVEEPVGG